MVSRVFVTILILSFVCLTFSCLFKQIYNDDNYEYLPKYKDQEYNLQTKYLDECIELLDELKILELEEFKDNLFKNAKQIIYKEIGENNIKHFQVRNLIQCIESFVDYRARKYFCPRFLEQYTEYDKIGHYLLMEFDDCVFFKNDPYIREVKFELPFNLIDDVEIH
ncbi:hypothetical protein GVAV_000270 [Gurleya vavrai]